MRWKVRWGSLGNGAFLKESLGRNRSSWDLTGSNNDSSREDGFNSITRHVNILIHVCRCHLRLQQLVDLICRCTGSNFACEDLWMLSWTLRCQRRLETAERSSAQPLRLETVLKVQRVRLHKHRCGCRRCGCTQRDETWTVGTGNARMCVADELAPGGRRSSVLSGASVKAAAAAAHPVCSQPGVACCVCC